MAQRTPEWFARRAGKFTGSRAADAVAGKGTETHKKLIWTLAGERIICDCAKTYQNGAMLRGIDLEDAGRMEYEIQHMVVIEQPDFVDHPDYPFVGYSPDGLIGADGLFELKVPDETSLHLHLQHIAKGYYAKKYAWQVQHGLWVTGREWADVCAYYPEWPSKPLAEWRVERNDKAIKKLEAACIEANQEVEEAVSLLKARAA